MARPDVWMPFYGEDYTTKTAHCSAVERGAYMDLIWACWKRKNSLPVDDGQLMRLARCTPDEWATARATVMAFFYRDGEQYRSKRVGEELAEATARYERKVAAGRAGGVAKALGAHKESPSNARGVPVAMPYDKGTQPQPHSTYVETKEANASLVRERPAKKSTSLPEGWIPNERNVSDAEARGYSAAHIRELAEHFRDHHRAKGTTSRDWNASWRTWLANDKRFNPERLGRGRAAGNRQGAGNIVDVVARLKAKADLEGQNDGRGMGRGGDGLRASGEHSGGNDGEGAGAGGIVLEADEASRMYRAAWGVETADGAEAGIDGQHGGAASGVLPEADGIPIGRGAEGAYDAGGSQQMVAGLGGIEGAAGTARLAAAEAFGGDDLEIPDFLDRRHEIAGRA